MIIILDNTNLATTVALNTKLVEVKSKITDNTSLVTKAALNTKSAEIENKIPDTAGFITSLQFNRLTKISFMQKPKRQQKVLYLKVK